MLHATTRRLFTMLLATSACLALTATAGAGGAPVEPYASYQPQSVCSPKAKPGTQALGRWVVRAYGGGYGRISGSCKGRSVSEHKEGRAFDWSLDAAKVRDRARAQRFMKAVLAAGPSGEPAELARRMGIMYVIWNDHIYASYDHFRARDYRSSSCRGKKLAKCSRTVRHRDHLHISLTRAGGGGRTSWYTGRTPAARPR
jgi:hypothetical protein